MLALDTCHLSPNGLKWDGRGKEKHEPTAEHYPTGSRNIPEAQARTPPTKLSKFLRERRGNTYTERSKTTPHTPGRQQPEGRRSCRGPD